MAALVVHPLPQEQPLAVVVEGLRRARAAKFE
jgi:hypothetical protein